MKLSAKTCTACQGGIPPLTEKEARNFLKKTPGWELDSSGSKIKRSFKFKNFMKSLEFVNKVGNIAEKEGHHPDINFGWGYCDIVIFTHKIKGLHENDFILAAKINEIKTS